MAEYYGLIVWAPAAWFNSRKGKVSTGVSLAHVGKSAGKYRKIINSKPVLVFANFPPLTENKINSSFGTKRKNSDETVEKVLWQQARGSAYGMSNVQNNISVFAQMKKVA